MKASVNGTTAINRTALYMRVSTNEQRIDGYGLESQRRSLLSYVERNADQGMQTKASWIFTDTHTGSDFHRVGLQRLLKQVREKKIDTVVVWKIDRLSRSLKHLLEIFDTFQKHKVNFISLQENLSFTGPIGNFIFQILSSVSELERSLIKTRTRQGIITSAEMGNFTGSRVPFGYKPIPNPNGKGKKLEIIPTEKQTVEEIFRLYIYENMGYEAIAVHLNDLKTRKGTFTKHLQKHNKWTPKHIERIIPNTLYRGEFIANRTDQSGQKLPQEEWTIVAIPPCVDEITFAMAQRKRLERGGNQQNKGNFYLLSGKLYDISTPYNRKFSGSPRSKGGFSYKRKQFTDTEGIRFSVFEIPAKPIEEAVWERIILALKDPDIFIQQYITKNQPTKKEQENINKQLLELRETYANIELEQGRIDQAFQAGLYSFEKAEKQTAALTQKADELQANITETEQKLHILQKGVANLKNLKAASKQFKKNIENLTPGQKKLLVDLFVERIEVDRKELPAKSTKQKKWKRSLEVFFRFDPRHWQQDTLEGRTTHATDSKHKPTSNPDFEASGGERGGGYTFSLNFELVKKRVCNHLNRFYSTVEIVEVDSK